MSEQFLSELPDAHQIRLELSDKQREVRILKNLLKAIELAAEQRNDRGETQPCK